MKALDYAARIFATQSDKEVFEEMGRVGADFYREVDALMKSRNVHPANMRSCVAILNEQDAKFRSFARIVNTAPRFSMREPVNPNGFRLLIREFAPGLIQHTDWFKP